MVSSCLRTENGVAPYVLYGDCLPGRLIDALVHDSEAPACTERLISRLANRKPHAPMGTTHVRVPPAPGSGSQPLRRPLFFFFFFFFWPDTERGQQRDSAM